MNEPRHNTDLRFIDRDDAGTVGPDQTDIFTTKRTVDLDHVIDRDALGNTDHELDAGIGGLQDRIGAKWRGHKDQRSVALSLLHRIAHRIEHRYAFHFLTRLTRRHPRDDLRSIRLALCRVERAFFTSNPLHHHPRIFVHQN